jgi:hypothetical protein
MVDTMLVVTKEEAIEVMRVLQEYKYTRNAPRAVEKLRTAYVAKHTKSPFHDCAPCWDYVYFLDIIQQIEAAQLYDRKDVSGILDLVFVPPNKVARKVPSYKVAYSKAPS